jgi:GDP-mannose 6-dehydrogenase
MVELVERLIGKGYDLRVYDSNVRMAAIHGANKEYILNQIPHISKLMVGSMQEVLDHAETLVIGNGSAEFREAPKLLGPGQTIVDLVRISETRSVEGVYDGICW